MTEPNYWLMKSEPNVYGINDLKKEEETLWDGIRNYQARNFMRSMKKGDLAFFYHSNCKPPGIVGLMEVVDTNLIDPTQFDVKSNYFDPKSSQKNPKWDCAKLRYKTSYKKILSLQEMHDSFSPNDLTILKKGNRLSIIPIKPIIAKKLLKILENN